MVINNDDKIVIMRSWCIDKDDNHGGGAIAIPRGWVRKIEYLKEIMQQDNIEEIILKKLAFTKVKLLHMYDTALNYILNNLKILNQSHGTVITTSANISTNNII